MNNESSTNIELRTKLREEVGSQISSLTTKIPSYDELNDEEKRIVDEYISKIDLDDLTTVDEFGKEETERIYSELDLLIGTMKTHDTSMEDMFADLMLSLDGDEEEQYDENLFETFKRSPLAALRRIKNKPKRAIKNEKYRRARVLNNIGQAQQKLENIRSELRSNEGKLNAIANNSIKQYFNTQYQIVALQETLRRVGEEKEKQNQLAERSLTEINQGLELRGAERRISRKIDNCRGIIINAATKAIMSRLLAQHNEELASDYDQDLSTLLPELKGLIITAEANDSLIQSVETHNEFVGRVNEMLQIESNCSREAMEKVQEISSNSAINVDTAKVLTSNVIASIRSIKQVQEEGRAENEEFITMLDDFRANLIQELEIKDKDKNEEIEESEKEER